MPRKHTIEAAEERAKQNALDKVSLASSSISTPRKHTTESAGSRHATWAEQYARQIALDRMSCTVEKSPVSGLDMQRFFGASLRPKASIDLPPRVYKGKISTFSHTTGTSREITLPHEVLENILSRLPIFDLVVATGVSTSFRDAVKNSPTLQRKLFLLPTKGPQLCARLQNVNYGSGIVVTEKKESSSEADDGELDLLLHGRYSGPYTVATLCPFLLARVHKTRSVHNRVMQSNHGSEKFYFSKVAALAEHWADMYLTDPPCKEMTVHLRYRAGVAKQYSISAVRDVYCEAGITLGSILKAVHLRGVVEIKKEKKTWWWSTSARGRAGASDDITGVRRNATVSRAIAKFEERSKDQSYYAELDLDQTMVEFPKIIMREWTVLSTNYYVRSGESRLSARECQVTADDEALQ